MFSLCALCGSSSRTLRLRAFLRDLGGSSQRTLRLNAFLATRILVLATRTLDLPCVSVVKNVFSLRALRFFFAHFAVKSFSPRSQRKFSAYSAVKSFSGDSDLGTRNSHSRSSLCLCGEECFLFARFAVLLRALCG